MQEHGAARQPQTLTGKRRRSSAEQESGSWDAAELLRAVHGQAEGDRCEVDSLRDKVKELTLHKEGLQNRVWMLQRLVDAHNFMASKDQVTQTEQTAGRRLRYVAASDLPPATLAAAQQMTGHFRLMYLEVAANAQGLTIYSEKMQNALGIYEAFLKDLQYAKQLVDSQQAAPQPGDVAKLQAYVTGQRKIMHLWDSGRVEYIPATTRAIQLHNQRYPKHIIDSAHAAMLVALELTPKQKDRLLREFMHYNGCLRNSSEERRSIVNILQQVLQQHQAPGPDSCGSTAHLVQLEARLVALRSNEDTALTQLVKLLMGSELLSWEQAVRMQCVSNRVYVDVEVLGRAPSTFASQLPTLGSGAAMRGVLAWQAQNGHRPGPITCNSAPPNFRMPPASQPQAPVPASQFEAAMPEAPSTSPSSTHSPVADVPSCRPPLPQPRPSSTPAAPPPPVAAEPCRAPDQPADAQAAAGAKPAPPPPSSANDPPSSQCRSAEAATNAHEADRRQGAPEPVARPGHCGPNLGHDHAAIERLRASLGLMRQGWPAPPHPSEAQVAQAADIIFKQFSDPLIEYAKQAINAADPVLQGRIAGHAPGTQQGCQAGMAGTAGQPNDPFGGLHELMWMACKPADSGPGLFSLSTEAVPLEGFPAAANLQPLLPTESLCLSDEGYTFLQDMLS
ncbi:hypothetical protein WJX73_000670 [Symbiochloris irregularis]|uniref:Uncharacterized protein n=1 Tax=Symbiochloris irregularis TaxID=706552 RepID=A0AAW1NS94_9CHLO